MHDVVSDVAEEAETAFGVEEAGFGVFVDEVVVSRSIADGS